MGFLRDRLLTVQSGYIMPLGWSGYLWHVCAVILSIMIIMNLERTLRHSTGHTRWQIKYMLLGIGGIFLVRLFNDSHSLLFRSVSSHFDMLNVGALLVGNVLVSFSLFRGNPLNVSVYLSHKFLYNSLTVLIVGVYFILVAVFSWVSYKLCGHIQCQYSHFHGLPGHARDGGVPALRPDEAQKEALHQPPPEAACLRLPEHLGDLHPADCFGHQRLRPVQRDCKDNFPEPGDTCRSRSGLLTRSRRRSRSAAPRC